MDWLVSVSVHCCNAVCNQAFSCCCCCCSRLHHRLLLILESNLMPIQLEVLFPLLLWQIPYANCLQKFSHDLQTQMQMQMQMQSFILYLSTHTQNYFNMAMKCAHDDAICNSIMVSNSQSNATTTTMTAYTYLCVCRGEENETKTVKAKSTQNDES